MKRRYIEDEDMDDVFGMANIRQEKTGLGVNIWSDGDGISSGYKHKIPRVKILSKDRTLNISVSVSSNPKILAGRKYYDSANPSMRNKIDEAMKYISRNWDILMKHYNDEYDDEELFQALRERGEYK